MVCQSSGWKTGHENPRSGRKRIFHGQLTSIPDRLVDGGIWGLESRSRLSGSLEIRCPAVRGGDPALAEKVKDVPFWIIHGADDGAVRVEESQEIADALEKVNGKFHYTVIPLEQHDTWETVYLRPELYEWMENPTFDESPNLAIFDRIQKVPGETTEGIKPFTPAIEVPDAITVRIGNKILDMLSHQLPSMIPSNALSGSIPDIYDTSTTSGRTFQVRFSGITYTGQITNATVKAYRQDRINIQVALSNVQLNIGRTYVNGSGRSAVTGPILISFGHAGPVWLSFDVTPYIQGKQIKLRHAGTNFQIPPGNFSVSPPREFPSAVSA